MSDISPLPPNLVSLLNSEPISTAVKKLAQDDSNFANVLTEAFETANATNAQDRESGMELITGESDDMSGILIDMQKAELALQLTLQIRNKIVDAYNEVIRMSV